MLASTFQPMYLANIQIIFVKEIYLHMADVHNFEFGKVILRFDMYAGIPYI